MLLLGMIFQISSNISDFVHVLLMWMAALPAHVIGLGPYFFSKECMRGLPAAGPRAAALAASSKLCGPALCHRHFPHLAPIQPLRLAFLAWPLRANQPMKHRSAKSPLIQKSPCRNSSQAADVQASVVTRGVPSLAGRPGSTTSPPTVVAGASVMGVNVAAAFFAYAPRYLASDGSTTTTQLHHEHSTFWLLMTQ